MLQQVNVNPELLNQAINLSEDKNESQTLEMVLKTFIKLKNQAKIKDFLGKLAWDEDLEQMRLNSRKLYSAYMTK